MTPTTETTLRFTGDYPVIAVWAAAFGLAALMWLLYRRELRYHNSRFAHVAALLRSLAVFILVLALAGPVLRHVTTVRQLGRVVVVVDSSASMKLSDVSGAQPNRTFDPDTAADPQANVPALEPIARFQRAEDLLLKGATPLLKKLSETQDVELVLLRGPQTQRLWWHRQGGKDTSGKMPETFEVPADAGITNLDSTLREALGPATTGSALVVLSDGQHNATGSPEEFAAAMRQTGTPIFTVGFGTEVPPPDLSVLNVLTPESVFSEENLQGRVLVGDSLPSGTPAMVQVESMGRAMWEQKFTADGKGERSFDFTFPVKDLPPPPATENDKTLRLLTVRVAALGERANTEKTRANNTREVALHLLTKKRKVLIIDGRPRWEIRYIHNHFDRDDRWQATFVLDDFAAQPEAGSLQKDFPTSRDDLLSYDLVLLGDVPLKRMRGDHVTWLMEFVEKRGGGLILIDGNRGHLKAWAQDPKTSPLVPVSYTQTAARDGATAIAVTPEGENQQGLRLSDSPSANAILWPTLPAVPWHAAVQTQPGSVALANFVRPETAAASPQAASAPAIVFRPLGAGAVLYIATEDLWRWRYQIGDLYHQRLWMQLAAWIAAPPFQAEEKSLAIGTDRLRYIPGEQSEIRVRVRNARGEMVTDAQPRAFLIHEGEEVATLQLEPDPTHVGTYRAQTPPLKAGAYEIAVAESPTAMRSNVRLSLRVADAGNPEWATLTMNRALLEAMASASGGRFLREEQAATELPNLLRTLDRQQSQTREVILWSSWWWFGAVILLLTAEWLLRKRLKLL